MDTEDCTFDKRTHIKTHTQKFGFCFVCKFLIEIRAFKHNLITIMLNDEYFKILNKQWGCINTRQPDTKQGISS